LITASKSKGANGKENCAGKQEGKRSLQNLSAIDFLSIFPAPIAFADIDCNSNESQSKDLGDCSKITHATGFSQWLMTKF